VVFASDTDGRTVQAASGISTDVGAAITNTGAVAGTQDGALVFDGATVANTTVELDAVKTTTVGFTTTLPERTGSLEHGVFTDDDNRTAEIVPEDPGPPALRGSSTSPGEPPERVAARLCATAG